MVLQKHPFNVASFDKITRLGYTRIDKTPSSRSWNLRIIGMPYW